jgi:hypothetical protein
VRGRKRSILVFDMTKIFLIDFCKAIRCIDNHSGELYILGIEMYFAFTLKGILYDGQRYKHAVIRLLL